MAQGPGTWMPHVTYPLGLGLHLMCTPSSLYFHHNVPHRPALH